MTKGGKRKGAGRPRKHKEPVHCFKVYAPKSLARKFVLAARRGGLTLSDWFVKAAKDKLE